MAKVPKFLTTYDNAAERHKGADGIPVASPSYFANFLAQILPPDWRYEPFLKQWFHFDGIRWIESECGLTAVNNMVLDVMQVDRTFVRKADTVFDKSFVPAVKRLLESDKRIQIRIQDFDQQYELLNTPMGTINLRTGEMLEPDSTQLMTKMSTVAPIDDEAGGKCPQYLNHLRFISDNDPELMRYFELFSGYVLTGHIYLQEFYTWCGFGLNGKGITYKIWQHIMGDYAGVASTGQFAMAGRTAHKEQDLRLVGKRLVISEEISGWDLDKLKQFTDGGAIPAREMHGKTTTFIPQCKLLFLTNNPPKLSSTDYGVERRLKLITFRKRIEDSMRNPLFLQECLIPEAPYIMNRMVNHCVEFLKTRRLETPVSVVESSRDYFESENIVQQFIEDNCKTDPDNGILFGDFYDRMTAWAAKQGHDMPSKHKLGRQLTSIGYKRTRDHDRRYMGISWLDTAATTYITPYAGYSDEERYG